MASKLQLFLFLALILAVGTNLLAAPRGGLSKKDIKKYVAEYCDSETEEAKRAKIVKRLARASHKSLSKEICKQIGEKKWREQALDLAIHFKASGTLKATKKLIDSDHEVKIVDAIFLSGDKGSEDWLFNRWEKCSRNDQSDSFDIVDTAFAAHYVSPKMIPRFHEVLTGKKSSEKAKIHVAGILQFQMVLDDEQIEDVGSEWTQLLADFRTRSMPLPIEGRNLLDDYEIPVEKEGEFPDDPEDEFDRPLVVKYRDRFIVEPMGTMVMDGLDLKGRTIVFWVMALKGGGETVGVTVKGNALAGVRWHEGQWVCTMSTPISDTQGEPPRSTPGKLGRWTKVTVTVKSNIKIVCDQEELFSQPSSQYGGGVIGGIRVFAGMTGRTLVAAADVQKK